ncbi:MAG: GNAT family N-acetyltransferase [Parcubacteria group bacterium]|nr:GNAT family N-acetyltransferase [Parcubacteria group bacterium]
MIHVAPLQSPVTSQDVEDINHLNRQLSSHSKKTTRDELEQFLAQPGVFLVVAREQGECIPPRGHIVGKSCLHTTNLDDGTRKATVEQVVVDEHHRGMGIADRTDDVITNIAKEHHVQWIDLTSNPTRVAANKFYKRRGYALRETNVYRKML